MIKTAIDMKQTFKCLITLLIALFCAVNYAEGKVPVRVLRDTICISVKDLPRYTGHMNVEVTKDTTIFWMSFLSDGDSTGRKWINIRIDDLSEDTVKYIRNSILDFYYYKTKKKYKYYRSLKYVIEQDPGPGGVIVDIYKATGKTNRSWFYFTHNIMSNKPSDNGAESIIYSDEYKSFLSVLLELTYKYTAKRKGPWHEVKPGYYGWYWWE